MSFLRLTFFLVVFIFPFSISLLAQHPGIRIRKDREVKEDSMRQKLKRLADSIYELNGGKPALPPEDQTAPAPVPVKEIQEKPSQQSKSATLYWVAGAAFFLLIFWFILTRRRKGQG